MLAASDCARPRELINEWTMAASKVLIARPAMSQGRARSRRPSRLGSCAVAMSAGHASNTRRTPMANAMESVPPITRIAAGRAHRARGWFFLGITPRSLCSTGWRIGSAGRGRLIYVKGGRGRVRKGRWFVKSSSAATRCDRPSRKGSCRLRVGVACFIDPPVDSPRGPCGRRALPPRSTVASLPWGMQVDKRGGLPCCS